MTWFIGIFTDILGTCGIVLGGLIVAVLALLVIAFWLVLAVSIGILVAALGRAAWFWFCRSMVAIAPESSSIHSWFNEKLLDLKHPSRVRRRNKAALRSGQHSI